MNPLRSSDNLMDSLNLDVPMNVLAHPECVDANLLAGIRTGNDSRDFKAIWASKIAQNESSSRIKLCDNRNVWKIDMDFIVPSTTESILGLCALAHERNVTIEFHHVLSTTKGIWKRIFEQLNTMTPDIDIIINDSANDDRALSLGWISTNPDETIRFSLHIEEIRTLLNERNWVQAWSLLKPSIQTCLWRGCPVPSPNTSDYAAEMQPFLQTLREASISAEIHLILHPQKQGLLPSIDDNYHLSAHPSLIFKSDPEKNDLPRLYLLRTTSGFKVLSDCRIDQYRLLKNPFLQLPPFKTTFEELLYARDQNGTRTMIEKLTPHFNIVGIRSDGNCLFSSLANGTNRYDHTYWRNAITDFMINNANDYINFVPPNEGGTVPLDLSVTGVDIQSRLLEHLYEMKKDRVWGGDLEIRGFVDRMASEGRNIAVHVFDSEHVDALQYDREGRPKALLIFENDNNLPKDPLFLLRTNRNHYQVLTPKITVIQTSAQ